jgi:hypothetical protein
VKFTFVSVLSSPVLSVAVLSVAVLSVAVLSVAVLSVAEGDAFSLSDKFPEVDTDESDESDKTEELEELEELEDFDELEELDEDPQLTNMAVVQTNKAAIPKTDNFFLFIFTS